MRTDSSIRPHLYTLRLSPEEDARAKRIANYLELPISTMMRTLMLEKDRALGLDKPAASKGRK
jgi:hypothetical protein